METNLYAETVAAGINAVLEHGDARAVPGAAGVIQLSADADPNSAVNAVRATITPDHLLAQPVTLWHGAAEILVGAHGAISPTELVPGTRSLDVRVHPKPDMPARVVVSWLDGPTHQTVADRLANSPGTGIDIHLLREELDGLLADVIDAAFTASGDPARIAMDPVLARVSAVRDGRDIYHYLLEIATELLFVIKRRGGREYHRVMAAIGQLDDQDAVDAVLDDLDIQMLGGEFFPVRATDDEATLASLFTLVALAARTVSSRVRARVRNDVLLP